MEKLKLYNEWITEEKIIINVFLCYRGDKNWEEYINKYYNDIKPSIDWWVEPTAGHHLGFAFQSILNTNDMNNAIKISKDISQKFNDDILIVLSKGEVRNYEPIGENQDDAFVGCGRFFDKLVREKKKGVYIF